MKKIDRSRQVFIGLVTLCVISFLFVLGTCYRHVKYKREVVQLAKSGVQKEADRLVWEIEKGLSGISAAVVSVKDDMAAGKLVDKGISKRLEDIAESDPNIIRSGIVYIVPSGGDGTGEALRSVCYERKENKVRQIQDAGSYDYTKKGWYKSALLNKAGWSEACFDDTLKNHVVVFYLPVYPASEVKEGEVPQAVLYVELSLAWLKQKMDLLNLHKKDLGIVLSGKGAVLYYPVRDIVAGNSNIFTLLEAMKSNNNKNYEKQRSIVQKAVNGENGEEYVTARTGQSFWHFYRPIKSAEWSLLINFMEEAIPFDGKALRRQGISIALWLIVFLTTLAAILFRRRDSGKYHLWVVSSVFALLCLAAACYTWYQALSVPLNEYQRNMNVVDDEVSLNKFLAASSKVLEGTGAKAPVFIPTGLHIQSLEFVTANNVAISGYVWQRYAKGEHDGVSRGFVMPESKTLHVSEAYRFNEGKEEVIGWYFEAVIRQTLDYSQYPFDHPNISVWMRHKDFTDSIFLVPDLKGYRSINAIILPGLQRRLVLPGYAFFGTFFSYELRMTNSNFGVDDTGKEGRLPEIFYNIMIKRNFITPLVSKFFPIFIVVSMLFIVLLSFTSDTEKQKNFGLTGLAVVGLVVSFFFTTLLTQIDLRQQFNAGGLIFIENFNFITYFILLLSAVQAFLFVAGRKIWFIQYEHCLIPKLLYWPVFTALILAVTLVYFY